MARASLSFVVLIGLAACGAQPPPYLCENEPRCVLAAPGEVRAVDGDTYEYVQTAERPGLRAQRRMRLRLIGWDSPESGDAAACPAEAVLGVEVEARAKELVEGAAAIAFLPEGTDRYGRFRVHLFLDEVHVGHLLRLEGLAEAWDEDQGAARPDWCG